MEGGLGFVGEGGERDMYVGVVGVEVIGNFWGVLLREGVHKQLNIN